MVEVWLLLGLLVGAPEPAGAPLYPTWEKLLVKPQQPLRPVGSSGELTLLLYHTWPGPLHELRFEVLPARVLPVGPAVVLPEVLPTEIQTVRLGLRYPGLPTSDRATARLRVSAVEVAGAHVFEVPVPLTARGAAALNRDLALPVGGVPVHVTSRGRLTFGLECLGLAAILAWWLWRKRQVRRQSVRQAGI